MKMPASDTLASRPTVTLVMPLAAGFAPALPVAEAAPLAAGLALAPALAGAAALVDGAAAGLLAAVEGAAAEGDAGAAAPPPHAASSPATRSSPPKRMRCNSNLQLLKLANIIGEQLKRFPGSGVLHQGASALLLRSPSE